MNVTYLSNYATSDINNWSGTDYYISEALKSQKAELDFIYTPKRRKSLVQSYKTLLYRLMNKQFDLARTPQVANRIARFAEPQIKANSDVVFSPSSLPLALLNTNKPKVFYADATFAGMLSFYKDFSNLCAETLKYGNYLEQQALDSAQLAIFASDWAANTAIVNYNVKPDKIRVVPFGANVENNYQLDDIKQIIQSRSRKHCNLLFLGVDWHRKGADLAIRIAGHLNTAGLKTTLHMAGLDKLPVSKLPSFVVDHGFINKANETGRRKIEKLFTSSHFLLVPSRAEAYGLVYCEANSFGLPAIATDVGGVATIIKDEVNGKMFSLSATEKEYADYILDVFTNHKRYEEFAVSSYNEFVNRLNWDTAGKSIMHLLNKL